MEKTKINQSTDKKYGHFYQCTDIFFKTDRFSVYYVLLSGWLPENASSQSFFMTSKKMTFHN